MSLISCNKDSLILNCLSPNDYLIGILFRQSDGFGEDDFLGIEDDVVNIWDEWDGFKLIMKWDGDMAEDDNYLFGT